MTAPKFEVDVRRDWPLLALLANGFDSHEICRVTGLSLAANRSRTRRMRELTGTRNNAHLVYWALMNDHLAPLPHKRPFATALSPRQIEVVERLAHGDSHDEVGKALFITTPTVRTYIEVAKDKARAVNGTHLVALVWSHDLFV